MYAHEKETLTRIASRLRHRFDEEIVSIYAFGSRTRGDHNAWSDFDVLVVVKDKKPEIEDSIVAAFVEEEMQSGVSFTPFIKDFGAFDLERQHHSPFYQSIEREGILI